MGSRSGQNALGLKGSVAFTSAGIVLVRREHLEVAVPGGSGGQRQPIRNVPGRPSFLEAIVAMVCSVKMGVQSEYYERDTIAGAT